MRIGICDDSKDCNHKLRNMLINYMNQEKIKKYSIQEYISGLDLLEAYSSDMFDFIFLDLEMPYLSGAETAKRIREIDLTVDIIFVTYMHDQVLIGYNYNAKGFLYKEVSQNQINNLMDRLIGELARREDIGNYHIKQKFDEGTVHLRLFEVLYFESKDKYILAVTDEDVFEFRGKLTNVANDLKKRGFIRIHRSYLVNTTHVFKDFGDYLILTTGERLDISKKYRQTVKESFKGV